MEYRKKRSALMIENLVLVFLVVFFIILNDWVWRVFLAFILYLLIKDQIVNRGYHIKVYDKGFAELKGKKEKYIAYEDIEFISVNRKYKKYIAIGEPNKIFLIRNDIENREQLINHIISKSKTNKSIHVDERVALVLKRFH